DAGEDTGRPGVEPDLVDSTRYLGGDHGQGLADVQRLQQAEILSTPFNDVCECQQCPGSLPWFQVTPRGIRPPRGGGGGGDTVRPDVRNLDDADAGGWIEDGEALLRIRVRSPID